jgi:hypothetical protein
MKIITTPYQPEIIIAGGGTAGSAAAVAAARRGHKVLLLEEGNCLGGVSTAGGVNELYANTAGMGDILDRILMELGNFDAIQGRYFKGEYLKLIWQMMADEAGVDILFHTSVVDAQVMDGRLTKVMAVSGSQGMELDAQYFVDATGEGDLAYLSGADFELGHPENGRTLHMSLTAMFYDTGEQREPYLPPGYAPIEHADDLPGLRGPVRLSDNRRYANMTKVMEHDPTNPISLSQAEQEARRQLVRIAYYVQKLYPTYALISTGQKIGIREGRRIIGDYCLTQEDITGENPRDFPDGVAVATAQIDFHSLTRSGHIGWRQQVQPYAIPLRAMIPKGLKNVLVAGKPISGDQVALSSYRMIPTVCAMGQAAGTAAALAVEAKLKDIRSVEIHDLRAQLTRDGIELKPSKHQSFAPEITPNPKDAL